MFGDPLDEFDRLDAENERRLARLPVCKRCLDPIDQEDAVFLDGEWYCDSCLDDLRIPIADD